MVAKIPETAEELRADILSRYSELSKRLQQIARYVLDEPNEFALETLSVIADRCAVQPSAIVRFAQHFGFDGAAQMQRLFRQGLLSNHTALDYNERVRDFGRTLDEKRESSGIELLTEFVEGNNLALQSLSQTVVAKDLSRAVKLLLDADIVFIAGFRRSFPIAAYLEYSLQQAGKQTVFVSGVGGMTRQQVQTISPKGLMVAVSYQPYADEAVQAVETAVERGARVLSISDSPVSPIAKSADVAFQVREPRVRGFRTLAASLCLAQALVIDFAYEASRQGPAAPPRGRRRNRSPA